MTNESSTLSDYVSVIRRRRWLVIQAVIVIPLIAVALALHGQTHYSSEARVAIDQQIPSEQLNGDTSTLGSDQLLQLLNREAEVARSSTVERRTVAALQNGMTRADFEAATSVGVASTTGLLLFDVEADTPRAATELANTYARQYLEYRGQLTENQYTQALNQLNARIATYTTPEQQDTAAYRSLTQQRDVLNSAAALSSTQGAILDVSDPAAVSPSPVKNGIIGLVLGTVLGLLLAFGVEALDRRTKSVEDMSAVVGLPLLAEIPDVRGRDRRRGLFVMRDAPLTETAEAYRSLRTSVDLALAGGDTRSIMITSAQASEGKTTTACNLAAAIALTGREVTIVDFDLRRPSVHTLLGTEGRPGVADLATGRATIDQALQRVDLSDLVGAGPDLRKGSLVRPDSMLDRTAALRYVPAGDVPANVGDFLGQLDVARLLAVLHETSDVVIVDAPPVLAGGDGLALSSYVDMYLFVTRLGVSNRRLIEDANRRLRLSPAQPLGFIITAANRDPEHRTNVYGYGSKTRWQRRALVR